MKRLLTLLIVAGVIAWLVKTYAPHGASGGASPEDPIRRARAAAAASDARVAAASATSREADQGAGVTENMTPDQVRALLGSPDDVSTETLDSGVHRETWTYRSVGKTVVFENGVAVSIR